MMAARTCVCGNELKPSQKKYCSKDCYWGALYGVPKGTGINIDDRGYPRYTYGEHRGRRVHVVRMEQKLGRRLEPGEVVDHKDHDRTNFRLQNLVLKQHAQHSSEHATEYAALRKRKANGTFELENEKLLPKLLKQKSKPAPKQEPKKVEPKRERKAPIKPEVSEPVSNLPSVLGQLLQNEFEAGAGWR